jgi:AraC family transcriptional regulator, ethanolamine operon transcriptional activator
MEYVPAKTQVVEGRFDDIDALAESALAWDQEYEQLGRGPFKGQLTQFLAEGLQLGRETWSPGVIQRGSAPTGTWVFGLPLVAEGTLHIRRRPAPPGQLLSGTSSDDIGFTATGPTTMMVVVLPKPSIDRWLQVRRGIDKFDVDLPSPRWQVPVAEMARRGYALSCLLQAVTTQPDKLWSEHSFPQVEAQIFEVILSMIPSAEIIEPLHSRAHIARAILTLLRERLDDPPTITELCLIVGARERTLHLSCVEAFGRPPVTLLAELRLNAVHRALLHPDEETSVTGSAARYGFSHFGRFAAAYRRQYCELPSRTLAKSRGS